MNPEIVDLAREALWNRIAKANRKIKHIEATQKRLEQQRQDANLIADRSVEMLERITNGEY